ncbi:hypothetical protein MWU61_19700, partial [Loktanella sp. F6476L]|nr:hypothetical protein [Loktanella sp. F6476L]
DDTIYGGAGDDTIDAGDGADRVYGGEGDDTITNVTLVDRVSGGSGADEIRLALQDRTTGADINFTTGQNGAWSEVEVFGGTLTAHD